MSQRTREVQKGHALIYQLIYLNVYYMFLGLHVLFMLMITIWKNSL